MKTTNNYGKVDEGETPLSLDAALNIRRGCEIKFREGWLTRSVARTIYLGGGALGQIIDYEKFYVVDKVEGGTYSRESKSFKVVKIRIVGFGDDWFGHDWFSSYRMPH